MNNIFIINCMEIKLENIYSQDIIPKYFSTLDDAKKYICSFNIDYSLDYFDKLNKGKMTTSVVKNYGCVWDVFIRTSEDLVIKYEIHKLKLFN